MKEIIIHLGILMTILTTISGICEKYSFEFIIIKSIVVFLLWISASTIIEKLFKRIISVTQNNNEEK